MNRINLIYSLLAALVLSAVAGCAPAPTPQTPAVHTVVVPQTVFVTAVPTTTPSGAPATTPPPPQGGPHRPRGIYAELHVDLVIEQQQKTNPSITAAELHSYFKNLYGNLLDNASLSGLAVGIEWRRLNPGPPSGSQGYDWSYLDDAFTSVAAWNAANPAEPPKTVQVQVSAGFATPQWVLDQIPSCDGLFRSPPQTPPANCGKATFAGFVEGGGGVLPMPWNALYKTSFRTFLTALAARYEGNPAFVSMDVSGPTAASTEMIMPNNVNTPNQSQFGGIAPNEMWLKLLALAYPGRPAYQKTDQAFIDEWDAAIDEFGEIFSGVTLVATTGSGLPELGNSGFSVPAALKEDCPAPNMDCAAETTILSHFIDPKVGGANAKATQSSGMKGFGRSGEFNLGARAAKFLAQTIAQSASTSGRVLGGEQFATSAADFPVEEGCTTRFPSGPRTGSKTDASAIPVAEIPQECLAPGITLSDLTRYKTYADVPPKDFISPEQALYNVLGVYFEGTAAASSFGATPGTAPEDYLQIYIQDIKYASAHINEPSEIVGAGGASVSMSAQDLLNLAKQKLLVTSGE